MRPIGKWAWRSEGQGSPGEPSGLNEEMMCVCGRMCVCYGREPTALSPLPLRALPLLFFPKAAQVGGSFRPRNQPESDGAVEAYKSLMRLASGADTCRESRRVVAFV